MVRVNFKIDTKRKDEITAYVEEDPKFKSMSQFFRFLALKEIHDSDKEFKVPSELLQRLTRLEDEVDEIKEGVETIGSQLGANHSGTEVIAQEVYNAIPTAPVPNSAEIVASGRSSEELQSHHAFAALESDAPSTVSELAKHLGEDRNDIKEAIQLLKSQFLPIIDIVDDDGEKHYLKQEERR